MKPNIFPPFSLAYIYSTTVSEYQIFDNELNNYN